MSDSMLAASVGHMRSSTILWRRVDLPGYEFCELQSDALGFRLRGVALIAYTELPCRLDYDIVCNAQWETQQARVSGFIGNDAVEVNVRRSAEHGWSVNDVFVPALAGCIDIDLGFSPSTNLLPIRRLALAVGQRAEVRATWVKFPELSVEVLPQAYTRIGEMTYRYESDDGQFVRELTVNDVGFVRVYPELWESVTK